MTSFAHHDIALNDLNFQQDYNILVQRALYLVDRSVDRRSLPASRIGLAEVVATREGEEGKVDIMAAYDLSQIDPMVQALIAAKAK